ncbi:C1 family peptidase [Polaribacter sp.]|uniref:C1 family peptidase n=1 Tax=Polaribacter sp. TaxID=1920175 RepID=UPI003EF5060A
MKFRTLKLILFNFLIIFYSCDCETEEVENENPSNNTILFGTGWDNQEDFTQTIPVAINYSNYQSGGSLPANIDLTPKFPPIGHQGNLGTCVAWATGYYNKTYLDAVDKNLTASQIQSFNNQYSPTDLFFSIDASLRSCENGTYFDDAFNVLISRGVNTLANVPYKEICLYNSPGSAAMASSNRIKNFRRIQGSVNEIKEYLAQGIPVVIGAMVNYEFTNLKGNSVLNNLNYTGEEGGHAMVIGGYDDSRNAFRIVNSWGTYWGDNGYLWIDYNFLVNKFCIQNGQRSLFVAFNDNNTNNNPPTTSSGGPDLTALVTSDVTLYPNISPYTNARRAFFDVKNIGNQTMLASSNWNIYYLWVNAFNANNYGTIFRGEFTTAIPSNSFQNVNANYSLLNYNLAPGDLLGQLSLGKPYVFWDYFMPQVTGSYYLVLYIDKGNSNEINQTNNVFYVTQSPKYFNNGYSNKSTGSNKLVNKYQFEDLVSFDFNLKETEVNDENSLTIYRKLSSKNFANAYTSDEIVSFLKNKINNGGL